jgi:hypothetical protein
MSKKCIKTRDILQKFVKIRIKADKTPSRKSMKPGREGRSLEKCLIWEEY